MSLPQSDADRLAPMMATLRRDIDALTAATALDPAVIAQIRAFQSKLRERMKAIERQTFVEGGAEPLPHPPEALRDEAIPIARQLAAAGFQTPSLNALIADPESLRFHSMRDILDELDVIARLAVIALRAESGVPSSESSTNRERRRRRAYEPSVRTRVVAGRPRPPPEYHRSAPAWAWG